jgi:hypothetical protein
VGRKNWWNVVLIPSRSLCRRTTVYLQLAGRSQYSYRPTELKTRHFPKDHAVNAAVDIFGNDNVRFYGGGVPDVFLDSGDRPTDATLERLLTWSSTVVT